MGYIAYYGFLKLFLFSNRRDYQTRNTYTLEVYKDPAVHQKSEKVRNQKKSFLATIYFLRLVMNSTLLGAYVPISMRRGLSQSGNFSTPNRFRSGRRHSRPISTFLKNKSFEIKYNIHFQEYDLCVPRFVSAVHG